VEMSSQDEANKAIQELNGKTLGGRTITVQEARPQENRSLFGPRGAGSSGRRASAGNRRW
jgi:RNA recognition motif-containing protein